MVIFLGERLSASLSGYLSQHLLEVATHTYVGAISARVRMQLCGEITRQLGVFGAMTVIYTSNTPQGYTIVTYGETKYLPVEYDGIQLMAVRSGGGGSS
ncbi:MAG: type I-E CRISPR-associated endoribonuclease Cas2e [Roseiflexaceae bacterium]|jgi:CRISPR-associated protein Cas2|nr:type I-E CRISPR-associated endoribonuclease Cas2e [Chloroflexaceae bacterium]